jgi:DNA-binding MarR family transcriptional regulator
MSKHGAHDSSGQTPAAETIYKMAEVSRVLKSATSTLEEVMHRAAGTNELTLMHGLVLVHLSRGTSCKQVDLKSATGIAPAYLTKLIDELVIRGLVHRNRSSWDRRQIILALTMSGRDTASHLLTSLNALTSETQRHAIEELGLSLEHFREWFDGKGTAE